jgi:hypothetical protein
MVYDNDHKSLTVAVWPEHSPVANGTQIDLIPNFDFVTPIQLMPGEEITFRLEESSDEPGYTWLPLAEDIQLECVELLDRNLGNFETGFS